MPKFFTILAAVLVSSILSFAQQNNSVRGKVTDAQNEPLPGVSVQVKGTTTGTQSDENGNYTVNAPANSTLVFTYIGFQSQEIPVGNRTTLNVRLESSSQELAQVVVVGYGTQRKIDVTGSVAQVKGEEISKQASINPISALQGKVAGVQITNPGSPGASPQVRIRGVGTVFGNASPLYVVDGVWFDDISFLNPADIENMSILKDASSEAIYGVRAANGVVLITTKKGKGDTRINYDGYVGLQRVTNQVEMANASQYATLVNELRGTPSFANPESLGKGTNWFDVVLRNALTTNHHVSVGGGGEKSTYNFSLGYLKQEGTVVGNDYDRITARLQNEIHATKFLKLGYTAVGVSSKSNDIPGAMVYKAFTAAPVVPVFYADGSYGDPADFPIGDATNNPQAQLDFFNQRSRNHRVTGNVFGELTITKGLTFKTSFGGEFGEGEVRSYSPVFAATTNQFNEISDFNISRAQVRNWIVENTLTYDKTINDHKVTLLAGQSAQRYKSYNLRGSAQNVPYSSEGDLYIALGDDETRTIEDDGALATYASYFGRVNYAFKNRYLVNASLRADGSSKFVGDQRWGYFPSVGLGWIISDEGFMKNQQIFDNLKLKGSWGKVGNASVPANLSVLTVNSKASFTAIYGGQPATGANITSIVPLITYWERGVGTDIGLEAGLLNNRLTFELAWYNRKTEQAIFEIPILGSLGLEGSSMRGNQADFQNRGIEVATGWRTNINKDFSYSINGNFSYNHNKVLSVQTGMTPIYAGGAAATSGQLSTRTIAGQPIGQFFGLQVDGIFQTEAEVAASSQPNAKPGDFRYRDINGDNVIDAKDREVIGNPTPKYTYGLNTSFNYKAFDLTVDFQGVAGVDVYNANKGLRFGSENFSLDFYKNRWHGPGTSNTYPSANIGGGDNYRPNSWYVEDGSYFRVRNLQIGYSIPTSVSSKWGMQRLRIYANAQNAFNFFKYKGFSPEVTAQQDRSAINAGIDNGIYPLSATYNLGVNVSF